MKSFIYCLLLLLPFFGRAQQDTLEISSWELSDSIYGDLGTHINTGFLLNRTLLDTTEAFVYNTDRKSEYTSNADLYYRLMRELKMMALDTSVIPDLYTLFLDASTFSAKYEFNEDRAVYPIGIADFEYNYLDPTIAQNSGLITTNGLTLQDVDPNNNSAYTTKKCALIGPLCDYLSPADISIIFRAEDFKSNYKNINEISTIEVEQNGIWQTISFDQEFELSLENGSVQNFQVKITYYDNTTISNNITINSPELVSAGPQPKSGGDVCDFEDKIDISNLQHGKLTLKYCMIRGCDNSTNQPYKPYIFVTGWRPPILGQSFDRAWELYNDNHNSLLSEILNKNYDIYIVKFNIHENPQGHGMEQSAELLIRFIEDINSQKQDDRIENVIQGSSMGADIVRLALMKMENNHFADNTYPHHHTRLFISHDANFYGANIPLAYQYHVYSGFHHTPPSTSPIVGESFYIKALLYAIMEQKSLKELVTYHAKGNGFPFALPVKSKDIVPNHHERRTNFLTALANEDYNHKYFIPLPSSTRNVAISLGKISETNTTNTQNLNFPFPGQLWKDEWFPGIFKIKAAKYTTDYSLLYHRENFQFTSFFFPIGYTVKHKVFTKNMQEIDNASGSYLKNEGNLTLMTNFAYFNSTSFTFDNYIGSFTNQPLSSHKSVVTALAINENLWPSDGSMTLNMQTLGLMYNVLDFDPVDDLSNHYGYPNLGRPSDHFNITPFEAIAIDNELDVHINLEDSNPTNKEQLNSFIFTELEPWFLGLQNMTLGAQARSNYEYRCFRRAKYNITVGHLVTPMTDPGDYVVNENGHLTLQAGEAIDVLPGTTFKNGCHATLTIEYYDCHNIYGGKPENDDYDTSSTSNQAFNKEPTKEEFIENSDVRAFPNPSDGSFTLVNMQDVPISYFEVYNLSGNLVLKHDNVNVARFKCTECLNKGVYIVHVAFDNIVKQLKIVVP